MKTFTAVTTSGQTFTAQAVSLIDAAKVAATWAADTSIAYAERVSGEPGGPGVFAPMTEDNDGNAAPAGERFSLFEGEGGSGLDALFGGVYASRVAVFRKGSPVGDGFSVQAVEILDRSAFTRAWIAEFGGDGPYAALTTVHVTDAEASRLRDALGRLEMTYENDW